MPNEPVLIRRTATTEEAEIIVAWLDSEGIKAFIPDRDSFGTFAFGVTDHEGVEIYAADEAMAKKAREALDRHDRAQIDQLRRAGGSVKLKCTECGEQVEFGAGMRGSTQECPECGAYVDIPGDAPAG